MKIKRVIDISRRIYPKMLVWPGEKEFRINRTMAFKKGDVANVSSIEMGSHTGTHIDSPLHFLDNSLDICSLNLSKFICFAKVFELNAYKKIHILRCQCCKIYN